MYVTYSRKLEPDAIRFGHDAVPLGSEHMIAPVTRGTAELKRFARESYGLFLRPATVAEWCEAVAVVHGTPSVALTERGNRVCKVSPVSDDDRRTSSQILAALG